MKMRDSRRKDSDGGEALAKTFYEEKTREVDAEDPQSERGAPGQEIFSLGNGKVEASESSTRTGGAQYRAA